MRLRTVILFLFLGIGSPSWAAFDFSEYRTPTHGAPHYCNPTRALANNGAGTLGDPWNMVQCATQPVADNRVGILPVGAGTPVSLPPTANNVMVTLAYMNGGIVTNDGTFTQLTTGQSWFFTGYPIQSAVIAQENNVTKMSPATAPCGSARLLELAVHLTS